MDVGPLIEYFSPLLEWLKVQNQNESGGWMEECPSFLNKVDMETAKQWLKKNNEISQIERSKEGEVEWAYATNITDENSKREVNAYISHYKTMYLIISIENLFGKILFWSIKIC